MQQTNHNEYDVFISYRHETGFYMAQILYSALIANGFSVFMDKNMDSGRYEEKIHAAILNSRNFIVVLFPDDLSELNNEKAWLNIESTWAKENRSINIIPVMCDGFEWPKDDQEITETMQFIKKNNGLVVHKDYSLDRDLENLCDTFLKNVSPTKTKITALDFLKYNLEQREDITVTGVDVAFHAGAPWLTSGPKNKLLISSLKNGIKWRVLINTPEAAESIGKHMRDETVFYIPFSETRKQWKKLAEMYPSVLEVRECDIPLIHIHHAVRYINTTTQKACGDLHVRYYAYKNTLAENAFEHIVSSYAKSYAVYTEEFEFLWEQSENI